MIQQRWSIISKRRPSSIEEVREILLDNRRADGSFLDGALGDLEAYLVIKGMDEGARTMAEQLARRRRIVLVGDYDCDGITSAAQMAHFLTDIGYGDFSVVIPNRSEGYGIPKRAVTDNPDAGLLVAMDCGTFDAEAVALARERGTDCVVIDHHEVSDKEPAPATVLINPKQPGCPSVFKDFCSSGLTLLFLTRLRKALAGVFPPPRLGGKFLGLAAIGTVADMVPLVGGNRILVRYGLQSMNDGNDACLERIAAVGGLSRKRLTAGHLGYYIGPRINAAGRMADPAIAFNFLFERDSREAWRLGQELNRLNGQRQKEEERILEGVRACYTTQNASDRTFVTGEAGWSAGVIGIVASRIQQEIHYGPVVVFSLDPENGLARGSARSIPGFDIHLALRRCDDLLLRWGGHKMAAGMTVALEKLDAFAHRFETVARECSAEIFVPNGRVDSELDLRLVCPELLDLLGEMEPYGLGNPTPTFVARNAVVTVAKVFGRERNHLRLILDDRAEGIFWRGDARYHAETWARTEKLDVVFTVEWDAYSRKPVLNVKGIGREL